MMSVSKNLLFSCRLIELNSGFAKSRCNCRGKSSGDESQSDVLAGEACRSEFAVLAGVGIADLFSTGEQWECLRSRASLAS